MTPEQATALRAPFPASAVGHLPKLTCKKCTESSSKVCDEHKKQKCATCGNYLSTAHIDLEYVGHAATSDRLLQVDPEWTWKPMAVGPNGEPLVTNGGMWIELTVCGVTRPGFGDGKSPKEIIGDAIRNAAMRFGVALDLWTKEDLQAAAVESHPPSRNGDSAAGTPFSYDHEEPLDPPLEQVLSGSAGAMKAVEGARTPPVAQAPTDGVPAPPADKLPSDAPAPSPASEGSPPITEAQKKKANVLVGKLRPDHISTLQLWQSTGREPVTGIFGEPDDGVLHWRTLRDRLTKAEAHELIERLQRFADDKLGAVA